MKLTYYFFSNHLLSRNYLSRHFLTPFTSLEGFFLYNQTRAEIITTQAIIPTINPIINGSIPVCWFNPHAAKIAFGSILGIGGGEGGGHPQPIFINLLFLIRFLNIKLTCIKWYSILIINLLTYTNATNNDTDSKGLNDYDEIFVYFTDPNNPGEKPESPIILIWIPSL